MMLETHNTKCEKEIYPWKLPVIGTVTIIHPAVKRNVGYLFAALNVSEIFLFILYAQVDSNLNCVCLVHFGYSVLFHVKSYMFSVLSTGIGSQSGRIQACVMEK